MAAKSNLDCFHCQAEDVSVECVTCGGPFCKKCNEKFHNHPSHPDRQKHIRKAIVSSSFAQCNSCGSDNVEYFCTNCEEQQLFCTTCDHLFHDQEEKQGHVRKKFCHLSHLILDDGIHCCHSNCTVECKDCSKSFCSECDEIYHDYPHLEDHTRKELKRVCSFCEELSITVRCDECSRWYCDGCDESRHMKKLASHIRKQIQEKSPKEQIICGLEEQNKELTKSVEVYKTALEQLKVKKVSSLCCTCTSAVVLLLLLFYNLQDSIVHQKEAQIQTLENNLNSLQDRHEMEKVQHNREIQTKDSLIQEHISTAKRQKEQTESLENENRDLQNQIKTLKIPVTEKEAELQRYLPQNREGIWKKYSGGDVSVDGVVAHEGSAEYVCRAEVDGDVVPGVIWSIDEECEVYHNGSQHYKSSCEVLVPNSSFEWIGCHGDEILHRAVPGGKTKGGEVLYVGRVKDTNGYYAVGKVQPSLNGCYNIYPANGEFTIHPKYEILVWK